MTGLLIFIPFGLIWFLIFRLIKKHIQSVLNYSFLILCAIVALMAYCGLCVAMFSFFGGQYGNLLMGVSYSIGITIGFLLLPTFILTIILFIVRQVNKNDSDL